MSCLNVYSYMMEDEESYIVDLVPNGATVQPGLDQVLITLERDVISMASAYEQICSAQFILYSLNASLLSDCALCQNLLTFE